jgi:glucose/arabinose dehydrogenase
MMVNSSYRSLFATLLAASAGVAVTAGAEPLAPPLSLRAVSVEEGVALDWVDHTEGELTFLIERREADLPFRPVGRVSRNRETFVDRTTVEGRVYDFRVRATAGHRRSKPASIRVRAGGRPYAIPAEGVSASVPKELIVPPSLQSAPFDRPRTLLVPPGFQISFYARVENARFLAVAPNGDLFVSQPNRGSILLLRPSGSSPPEVFQYASNLSLPHDMVFHAIEGITYLYVAEGGRVTRYRYTAGDTKAGQPEILVTGLPEGGGHPLKNIAIDRAHRLYVAIASSCNVCTEDLETDPMRGAIYRYPPTGGKGTLYARGLRNAEGLDFLPGTDTLWVTVNHRDRTPYPYRDASGNYGRVIQSFVDDYPAEFFTAVKQGADYGWPFANPNPGTTSGFDNMPFDLDVEMNPDGKVPLSTFTRVTKGIQAHSAPLGLLFLQKTAFPLPYRNGAVIAYHGSWNRERRTGYRVAYFPWNQATGRPGLEKDLVTGWLDEESQQPFGRPVDVAVDAQGGMFISDDGAGAIYRLSMIDGANGVGIKSLIVYDAAKDKRLGTLRRTTSLSLRKLGTQSLSLRAVPTTTTVGSIAFVVNGKLVRIDNTPPYFIPKSTGRDLTPWPLGLGRYRISVIPYSGKNGSGAKGRAATVTLIINQD